MESEWRYNWIIRLVVYYCCVKWTRRLRHSVIWSWKQQWWHKYCNLITNWQYVYKIWRRRSSFEPLAPDLTTGNHSLGAVMIMDIIMTSTVSITQCLCCTQNNTQAILTISSQQPSKMSRDHDNQYFDGAMAETTVPVLYVMITLKTTHCWRKIPVVYLQ